MGAYRAWFQALFLLPHKCMGVQLRPYSFAHYEFLKLRSSPYLMQCQNGDPATTTRKDLLEAVWICSRTYRELKQALHNHTVGKSGLLMNWRTWRQDFAIGDAQMRTHIEDHKFLPGILKRERKENDGVPKLLSAPVSFCVTGFLRQHEGLTFDESWDFPIGLGRSLMLCWQENQGLVDLESEDDEITAALDKQRTAAKWEELETLLTSKTSEEAERIRAIAIARWGTNARS